MKYIITFPGELSTDLLQQVSEQLEAFFKDSDDECIIINGPAKVHAIEGDDFLRGKLAGLNESYAIHAEAIRQLREYKKRPWWQWWR